MKDALGFSGSVPIDASPDEIRRFALEDFRSDPDPDIEAIPEWADAAARHYQIAQRLREIANEAWRAGRFKDLADDRDDLQLVIEYATHTAAVEFLRWDVIRKEHRPDSLPHPLGIE